MALFTTQEDRERQAAAAAERQRDIAEGRGVFEIEVAGGKYAVYVSFAEFDAEYHAALAEQRMMSLRAPGSGRVVISPYAVQGIAAY